MEQKFNPLIAVTTYNQVAMTHKCLDAVEKLGYDILIIDDCSTEKLGVWMYYKLLTPIIKKERKGLTDGWNLAYKRWKLSETYSHLILMNNDVIVPKDCIENMLSDHPLVVPMTSYNGAGYASKDQAIDYHVDVRHFDPVKSIDAQNIQDLCKREFKTIRSWTGFMMCMSRGIIEYERDDGNLFDPKNINVGNDDDLAKRVQAHIALGSFVYHYKGVSFFGRIAGRNEI